MIATGTPIGSFGTFITPRLATGGAISALQDVDILVAAGVTCIVDCRAEFNDGQLLASRPGVAYLWNPTADDGQHKDATWFDRSLRFCLPYLAQPGQRAYLHCTPPGTVLGAAEPQMIEAHPTLVIGADGAEHPATAHLTHYYRGELLTIEAYGVPTLRCTPDHTFLVYRPYRYPNGQLRKANWTQTRYTVQHIAAHERSQPEWLSADEVRPGDALLSPYWRPTPEQTIFPLLAQGEHRHAPSLRIPALDADIAWLCGLFAGDGHATKLGIGLTLSRAEDVDRASAVLARFGRPVAVDWRSTYARVRINSIPLAEQFSAWFGRSAPEKRLPAWLMRSPFRTAALDGLLAADGHQRKDRTTRSLRVTSQTLAWQTWHLATAQGHRPTLKPWRRHGGYANGKPMWAVEWTPGGAHHRTFHWRGYYGLPVRAVGRESYDGPVHTLSVPEGESYLTNGAISHNCAAGVNRGPSTALAVLMALGWTQDAAFALIKQARPIVNIAYAADAAAAISALGYA